MVTGNPKARSRSLSQAVMS